MNFYCFKVDYNNKRQKEDKQMKRKLVSILLTAVMALSLVGCGAKTEPVSVEEAVETEAESVAEMAEPVSETEAVEELEETEQVEESKAVEALEGFQYQMTFDVGGIQKAIGFNTPDGYELESSSNQFHKFVNTDNDYFTITPFILGEFGEDAINRYENYCSTGEWKGLYDFITEDLLNERTVEVPGGTATIITGSHDNMYKTQNVFIDFDGCIVHMGMYLQTDFMIMDEVVSGTEEEFVIDEVLAQLFVESDNTEYLYPISDATVEVAEDAYEYSLSYYDIETEKPLAYLGFNLPEGDFVQSEEDVELAEIHSKYGNSYYEFTDSIGNVLNISEASGMGKPYETVCVYRHFLRTGEMTEGVENVFFGEGGWTDMHTGSLVDMQLGETVETPCGTVYVVKALWQYDVLTDVCETVMFKVNGKEVVLTFHNKNAEPGVTLDSYEGQLKGMLAEMF